MKKNNVGQPVILTKLSSWDKAQHRHDLGYHNSNVFALMLNGKLAPEFVEQYNLEQRFKRTFGGE